MRAELQWRPWMCRQIPVEGYERFEAARARSDAGVIVANLHVGPFLRPMHALAAGGVKLYLPGGMWGVPKVDGLRGRWIATQNRWVEEAGWFLQEAEQAHAHAIDVWDDAVARLTRPKVRR